MKSTEDMTSILNLPIYISLLPEYEQDNELDALTHMLYLKCLSVQDTSVQVQCHVILFFPLF